MSECWLTLVGGPAGGPATGSEASDPTVASRAMRVDVARQLVSERIQPCSNPYKPGPRAVCSWLRISASAFAQSAPSHWISYRISSHGRTGIRSWEATACCPLSGEYSQQLPSSMGSHLHLASAVRPLQVVTHRELVPCETRAGPPGWISRPVGVRHPGSHNPSLCRPGPPPIPPRR